MYVGPAISGLLHLGLLALALAPARPEPIISPDSGPPVAVEIMSLDEYNAAISRAPNLSSEALLPPTNPTPPAPDVDVAINVPRPTPSPSPITPSPDSVTLSSPPDVFIPEIETSAPQSSPVDADTKAPDLALDSRSLQDAPVNRGDILPDDRVRIVTAPEAPKQPRGVLDAPDIDTDPDQPPEPEELAEPTPDPAPSTDVAEATEAQRNGAPPSDSPVPRAKPRGSLAAESSDEKTLASPVAEAGEGPQQRNTEEDQDRTADAAREALEKLTQAEDAAAAEQLAAEVAEEERLREEDARIAAEDARIEAEQKLAEIVAREEAAKAEAELAEQKAAEEEAARAAERVAKLEAEEEARRLVEEEAKRLVEAELAEAEARKKAAEEAKRLAEAELEKQRLAEEEAKRLAEAELERQRLVEAESQRKAEEELAAKLAAEEEAKRLAEAELEKQRIAEATARKKAEEELAAQRAAEEEAKRLAEAELERQRVAEAELAAQRAAEAEAQRLAEERRKVQEEAEALRRAQAELEARRQAEVARQQELVRQQVEQRAREQQRVAEEEQQRLAEEQAQRVWEAEQRRLAAEAEAARQYALRQQQLQQYNSQPQIGQQTDRNLSVGSGTPAPNPAPAGDSLLALLGNAVGSQGGSSAGGSRTFTQNVRAQNNAAPLTQGEQQQLLNQLSRCWQLFGQTTQIVTMRVTLTREGRVSNATPISGSGLALEHAMRALQNTACQPFQLPPQKYGSWQQIDIVFDPRKLTLQ